MKFTLALLCLFVSAPVFSASIDCNNVTDQIEQEICDDRKTSKLNSQLNELFKRLHLYGNKQQQITLEQQQQAWLKLRSEQCLPSSNTRLCLREAYQQRLKHLEAEGGFLKSNMEQDDPRLLQFIKYSKIFDMLEYPSYYKINQRQFIVAIDWDQSGKIGHGLYYVDLTTGELERMVGGLPKFDGIYQDQNRAVVVIRNLKTKSGITDETVSAVVINNGVYSSHKIISVNYYRPDHNNNDACYDSMNDNFQGRLMDVSTIQLLQITDVDDDGLRDVTVNIDRKDCKNGQTENKTLGLVSAAAVPQASQARADTAEQERAAQSLSQSEASN